MADVWILVADRARARLFSLDRGAARMNELEDFVNAATRTPGHEREHASPPRVHDRFGEGRHAIEAHTPLREKVALQFAAMLGSALEHAHAGQRFHDLVLIAPPGFLGMLNAALGPRLRAAVALKLAKNLTRRSAETILAEIPRRLSGRGPFPLPAR